MRKSTILLFLFTFMLVSTAAWAHPAKNVDLAFDKATKILTATVTHEVKDNFKHYIQTVEIKITKKSGLTHNLIMQDDFSGGIYKYKLNDVKSGDVVTLTTTCNILGKKSAVINIK